MGTMPAIATSSLASHVTHVVGMRSQPQMLRTNASRGVTVMENIHAFGDLSESQFPHQSVNRIQLVADDDAAVPVALRSGPQPALAGAIGVGADSFRNR